MLGAFVSLNLDVFGALPVVIIAYWLGGYPAIEMLSALLFCWYFLALRYGWHV